MFRYTTAKIKFRLITPIDFDTISDIWVTLQSNITTKKTWKLSKEEVSIDKDENTVILKLTQGDTSSFNVGTVDTQLRFINKDGEAFASNIKKIEISRVLEEGIMNVINTTSDPVDPPTGDPTDPPSGTTDPTDPPSDPTP